VILIILLLEYLSKDRINEKGKKEDVLKDRGNSIPW